MRTASLARCAVVALVCSVPRLGHADAVSSAPACVDVDKRQTFDASNVVRDVAAFDVDNDKEVTEEEYRNYLMACDRRVRSKSNPQERENEVQEAMYELVSSREVDCEERPDGCVFGRRKLHVVQAFAIDRAGDLFVPYKPKPTEIAPTLSVSRSLLDSASPLSKDPAAKVPFLVSYKRDYAKNEDSGLLLGKLSYGPWFWGARGLWDGNVSTTFDVNTGKDPEESSIAFGATATYTRSFHRGKDGMAVAITPEYGTDGNGDRDVVTLRTQWSLFGDNFLGAGKWLAAGRGYYVWDPSLGLYCGEVRDDGGNASLAKIAEQGSYCRAQPGLEMRWRTDRLAQYAFGLRLGYSQTYDLQDHWDRGYGEAEASMGAKDSPLQLILLYRKGRKAPAFEDEKALILGIGIQL